jgi:hypothetical protein
MSPGATAQQIVADPAIASTVFGKAFSFEGSNNSTNGNGGTWTSLFGPIDMPSGSELQWWEAPAFVNTTKYKWYRVQSMTTPSFAIGRDGPLAARRRPLRRRMGQQSAAPAAVEPTHWSTKAPPGGSVGRRR